ncbi:MAG: ribonuclease P protein component [Chloroflexota bacterium]
MPKLLKPLKGKKNFDALFKEGVKFRSGPLFAVFLRASSDTVSLNFVASVSKRTAKKAVVRNRIKRLLRESFRKLNSQGAFDFDGAPAALFLSWQLAAKKPSEVSLKDALPAVERAVATLRKKTENKNEDDCDPDH